MINYIKENTSVVVAVIMAGIACMFIGMDDNTLPYAIGLAVAYEVTVKSFHKNIMAKLVSLWPRYAIGTIVALIYATMVLAVMFTPLILIANADVYVNFVLTYGGMIAALAIAVGVFVLVTLKYRMRRYLRMIGANLI